MMLLEDLRRGRRVEFIFLRQLAKEHKEDDSGLVSPSSQKKKDFYSRSQLWINFLLQLYIFDVFIVCTLTQQHSKSRKSTWYSVVFFSYRAFHRSFIVSLRLPGGILSRSLSLLVMILPVSDCLEYIGFPEGHRPSRAMMFHKIWERTVVSKLVQQSTNFESVDLFLLSSFLSPFIVSLRLSALKTVIFHCFNCGVRGF